MKIEWDYEEALRRIGELEDQVSKLENDLSYTEAKVDELRRENRYLEHTITKLVSEVHSLRHSGDD